MYSVIYFKDNPTEDDFKIAKVCGAKIFPATLPEKHEVVNDCLVMGDIPSPYKDHPVKKYVSRKDRQPKAKKAK